MSDVLYIHQLAEKLDTSVEAIRGHIKRRTNAIPPWFYRGRRVVWRTTTVEQWLDDQEEEAMRERVSRPARRRLGGSNQAPGSS